MIPDITIPLIALLFTSGIDSFPFIPASNKRCAPEKVIYPPTVPPTMVIIACELMVSGIMV
jgi:hypothetical protein